jgi:hypothetical protein
MWRPSSAALTCRRRPGRRRGRYQICVRQRDQRAVDQQPGHHGDRRSRRLAAGASQTHPSNAPPEQEEVATAADDAPDARDHRRRPVSVHLHAPARPVVLDEAQVKPLGASTWADQGGAERRVGVSNNVQDRVDHLAGIRPVLHEDRSILRSSLRHSLSSGMSSNGRMSPRPTSFVNRGDGSPSGSFMNRSRVTL